MGHRITTLVDQARHDQPAWMAGLGQPGQHDAWVDAIRQVVAYRTVYEVAGADPLGPEPDWPGRQRQAWQAAHDAVQACTAPPASSNAIRLVAVLNDTESRPDDDRRSDSRGPTRHL
jgi:hypothetical protein